METTIQNVSKKAGRFVKQNAPTILTFAGAAGLVATSISTAKATTKATMLLDRAIEEKGEELTALEAIQVALPVYIPAILFGAATLTCMFSANALNKRKQASLIGAYTMLDRSYKEYKGKVTNLLGEDANKEITESIAKDHYPRRSSNTND